MSHPLLSLLFRAPAARVRHRSRIRRNCNRRLRKLRAEQLEWRELLAAISVSNITVPVGTSTVQVPITITPTIANEMVGAMNISFAAGNAGDNIQFVNTGAEFSGTIWTGPGRSSFSVPGTPATHFARSAVAMLSPLQVPAGPGTVVTYTLNTASLPAGQYLLNPNHLVLGAGTSSDTSLTFTSGILQIGSGSPTQPPVVNDQTFFIAENSPNGTVVGTIAATDPNGVIVSYSAPGAAPAFNVNNATGQITVANSSLLDFETNPNFTFTVTVTDNSGLTDTATIQVNLTDVNETGNQPPVVNNQSFFIAENSPNGTVVGNIFATDPNGFIVNYSAPGAAPAFNVNNATGQITVANSSLLDFETNPNFSFTVTVTDNSGLTDTATIQVNLTDVNETGNQPPVVNNQSFFIAENSPNGTVVGNIFATDPNGFIVNYSAPGAAPAFNVNNATGQITVANSSLLDFETNPNFSFTVTVTDNSGLTDTATIQVNLTDVNETGNQPPVVNDQTFSIAENSPAGTVVGTILASDPNGVVVNYSAPGAVPVFNVNSVTGQITVASPNLLNFEANSFFTFTATVTDNSGLTDTATIQVNLTNVNEAPVANDVSFTIDENSATGTVVGTVVASDPDTSAPNNTLNYAITAGNTGNAFTINSVNGQFRVNSSAALDFETTPTFTLTVQVTDAGAPSQSDTATVTVNLRNVHEGVGPEGLMVNVTPSALDEGQIATLTGSFAGALVGHNVTILWGDSQIETVALPAGVQTFSRTHAYQDDNPSGTPQDTYPISVTVTDPQGRSASNNARTVLVRNVAPTFSALTVNPSTVSPGDNVVISGSITDPGALDTFQLDVDLNGDNTFESTNLAVTGGMFSHSLPVSQAPGTFQVRVRVRDDDGGSTIATRALTVTPGDSLIVDVHPFYNNSVFDGNGAAVTAADLDALAPDKGPLHFGETASFENITGYSRGLNGIFIDFKDLPGTGAGINAADFMFMTGNNNFPNTWANAPAPTAVGVLSGAGHEGSDRVFITFADGAVRNTWLRITVKANADTGLPAPADFFLGNAAGETGEGFTPGVVGVDAADLQGIALNRTPLAEFGTEAIDNPFDLNRDATVDAFDLQAVAVNVNRSVINLITPQSAAPGSAVPAPLSLPDQLAPARFKNRQTVSSAAKDRAFDRFIATDRPQDQRTGSWLAAGRDTVSAIRTANTVAVDAESLSIAWAELGSDHSL